jgi:hypothetical protein
MFLGLHATSTRGVEGASIRSGLSSRGPVMAGWSRRRAREWFCKSSRTRGRILLQDSAGRGPFLLQISNWRPYPARKPWREPALAHPRRAMPALASHPPSWPGRRSPRDGPESSRSCSQPGASQAPVGTGRALPADATIGFGAPSPIPERSHATFVNRAPRPCVSFFRHDARRDRTHVARRSG